MDAQLAQIERHQGAVVVRTHAERPAGVQHEHGGTVRSDPTQNLDRAHRILIRHPGTLAGLIRRG